jgi:putative transposase
MPSSDHRDWHHAPSHRLPDFGGTYMVTAATYQKARHFNTEERLSLLQSALFAEATSYEWQLQAWAVFANHYHFVAAAKSRNRCVIL